MSSGYRDNYCNASAVQETPYLELVTARNITYCVLDKICTSAVCELQYNHIRDGEYCLKF